MSPDSTTKRCVKCLQLKPLDCFHKSKWNKGGIATHCAECRAQQHKDRVARNKQGRAAGLIVLPETKRCSICDTEKPISEFSRQAASRNGYSPACVPCQKVRYARNRAYYQQRYQDNKERITAINRNWIERNRERRRQTAKEHRARNKESRNAYNRAWWAKNKEHVHTRAKRYKTHVMIAQHKRRKFLQKNGGTFTPQEWRNLCAEYDYRCLRCGKPFPADGLTVDHIIPITRNGTNDISNIQPLCKPCNSAKQTRIIDYRPVVAAVWPLLRLLGSSNGI